MDVMELSGMPRCPPGGHGSGAHPDTRIDSRIRVSADPPDRQMPVGAAIVRDLKILCILSIFVANLALLGVPSGDDALPKTGTIDYKPSPISLKNIVVSRG